MSGITPAAQMLGEFGRAVGGAALVHHDHEGIGGNGAVQKNGLGGHAKAFLVLDLVFGRGAKAEGPAGAREAVKIVCGQGALGAGTHPAHRADMHAHRISDEPPEGSHIFSS